MLDVVQSETFARWLGTQDTDIKRAVQISKEWKD